MIYRLIGITSLYQEYH